MRRRLPNITAFLPWLTVIVIAAAYFMLAFDMPPAGDDIFFHDNYHVSKATWKGIPILWHQFWESSNSRMADLWLMILFPNLPLWAMALVNAAGTAGMFLLAWLSWCGKSRPSTLPVMIFFLLIAFTFRWDAAWMEFCTQSNLVWSAACGLGAILLATADRNFAPRDVMWLTLPLFLIAGWLHEAQGAAIIFGFTLYLLIPGDSRKLSTERKALIFAMIAGGVMSLTGNALGRGTSASLLPPEPILERLLLSTPFAIIMMIVMIIECIRHPKEFAKLLKGRFIIYAGGAFAALSGIILAGYGGRPGWYANLYALIAIFIMARERGLTSGVSGIAATVTSWLIFAAVTAHYAGVTIWQHRLADETRTALRLAKESPDNVIFLDFHHDDETPIWLLRKVHGVPDNDDDGYQQSISFMTHQKERLLILPEAFEKIDFGSFRGSAAYGKSMLRDAPLPGVRDADPVEGMHRREVRIGHTDYVERTFQRGGKTLYFYTPVHRDRGER